MDESVAKHLERPEVGTLKLSAAIRIGVKLRPPVMDKRMFFDKCGSCALGAAFHGMTGRVAQAGMLGGGLEVVQLLNTQLGIPMSITMEASRRFVDGMSREAVADWLEAQGY